VCGAIVVERAHTLAVFGNPGIQRGGMKVSARTLSLALVSGTLFLVACANGELETGEDPTGEWIADGGMSAARDGGTGIVRVDSGTTPKPDSGTTNPPAPTVDSGTTTPTPAVDSGSGACAPQYTTGNQACSDCSRSQCCSSMNAFFGDSSYQNFSTCMNGCGGTTSCVQSCKTQYPAIGAKFDAYYGCAQLSCSSACGSSGGGGGGGGTCTPQYNWDPSGTSAACNTCARSQCCAEMNAMFSNPQTSAYFSCLSTAVDQLDVLLCDTLYRSASQATSTYFDCENLRCAASCP
jgi:hypothetical protein